MHLSFVSPAPRYLGSSGALVLIVRGICACWCPCRREHVRGCGRGSMVIIWAGNLSNSNMVWHLYCERFLPWYGGRDFVSDLASKMPCPAGKSAYISGVLSASKERVWPWSPLVPGYPGAGDATNRCVINTSNPTSDWNPPGNDAPYIPNRIYCQNAW